MASYVALDFETANEQRASACSVGVVRVDGGQVTDAWSTLIDPETDFAPINVRIHGIHAADVVGAPTFPTVLERILTSAAGTELVVAHSAAFDVQVITHSVRRYGLDLQPLAFACTCVFSRHWWPGWPSYSLGPVVERLGLVAQLGGMQHHDALWDARAAAAVAERGLTEQHALTWEQAAAMARVPVGIARVAKNGGSVSPINPDRPAEEHPLYGRSVCFTGALQLYTRRDAAQALADVGGIFAKGATKRTDLLVVGTRDLARLAGHDQSSKMRKVSELAASGHPIEVIDEVDFVRLLAK